jgi:hypothetical protein
MGYDLRLHISEHVPYESARSTKKTPHHFSKGGIATLEMCNVGSDVLDAISIVRGKYVYIYDMVWNNDNNGEDVYLEEKVVDDNYGDRLKIIPVQKLLKILKIEEAKDDGYRRFRMAIAILESLLKDFAPKYLYVLPFGH